MSEWHKLVARRESLSEIRTILDAMKGFAFTETRKLARVLEAQRALVANLETVALDFRGFFPGLFADTPAQQRGPTVYLVLGTERGFCGDINRKLFNAVEAMLVDASPSDHRLFIVGQKLQGLMRGHPQVTACLDGASALEDIDAVLLRLVDTLSQHQGKLAWGYMRILYLGTDGEPVSTQLLPPFQFLQATAPLASIPPLLQLAPGEFYQQLSHQYLHALINQILTSSLMNENRQRVTHLDQAVSHLEDREDELRRRSNRLRQEEITEELEVILLSADNR